MIHAMPGKVVVVLDREDEKTAGGLYIPDAARESANVGTIVSVENENFERPLKEGDKILIGKYAGVKITYESQEYVVLKIDEILAFIAPVAVPS